MKPRLQNKYEQEVRASLTEKRGYKNPLQVPRIEKIVVNMGVSASKEKGALEEAVKEAVARSKAAGKKPALAAKA